MQEWYGGQADLADVFSAAPVDALTLMPEVVATECDDYSALSEISQSEELFADTFIEGIFTENPDDPWTCYLQEGVLRESAVPVLSFCLYFLVRARVPPRPAPSTPLRRDERLVEAYHGEAEQEGCDRAGQGCRCLDKDECRTKSVIGQNKNGIRPVMGV